MGCACDLILGRYLFGARNQSRWWVKNLSLGGAAIWIDQRTAWKFNQVNYAAIYATVLWIIPSNHQCCDVAIDCALER